MVGGITSVKDLNTERIKEFQDIWKETKKFVDEVYIPDLMAIASFYKDWGAIGGNNEAFLAYGDFSENSAESRLLMPSGFIRKGLEVENLDVDLITEDVTRAWYEKSAPSHPYAGKTEPIKGDPAYNTDDKYSWIKAPRYDGLVTEVGPLARVLVAYGRGDATAKGLVDQTLKKLGVGADALFSTLGRTAARGLETVMVGDAMGNWLNELRSNIAKGDKKTYQSWTMPDKAKGFGLNDVPRGSLGHWIEIEDGKIKNYQYVVPSTWNFGPADAHGNKGPVERSLIGTPIADPKMPLEVLRTVHSYDPCLACAVHVIDPHTNEIYKVRVV